MESMREIIQALSKKKKRIMKAKFVLKVNGLQIALKDFEVQK